MAYVSERLSVMETVFEGKRAGLSDEVLAQPPLILDSSRRTNPPDLAGVALAIGAILATGSIYAVVYLFNNFVPPHTRELIFQGLAGK